jgi:curved DNA-binding protein
MPTEFKDYYATLGVPRDADEGTIRKAFRKLAAKHHPDVAQDKRAGEEKFKELNEAYEVLGDPEKRRKYDRLGERWKSGAGFQPPPGAGRRAWSSPQGSEGFEFHFGGTGFSDFFEQFFGGHGVDEVFGGGRRRAEAPWEERPSVARGSDIEGDILVTLNEVIHGSIRPISLKQVNPRTGQVETHTFKVRVPAGVQNGQTIRVPAKGREGSGGGAPGDLYLHVRLAAHPDFRTRGADLYYDLALAPWDAVLGTTVPVPTLGEPVTVRIPPGTNSGQSLRVRGRGLPRGAGHESGHLYVVVSIELPTELTSEERVLWEDLRRGSRFKPRSLS